MIGATPQVTLTVKTLLWGQSVPLCSLLLKQPRCLSESLKVPRVQTAPESTQMYKTGQPHPDHKARLPP